MKRIFAFAALLLAPLAALHGAAPAFRLDSTSRWMIEYSGPTKPEVLRFAAEQLDAHLSRMLGEPARLALAERKWADAGYRIRLVTGGKTPPVAGVAPRTAPGVDAGRFPRDPNDPDRQIREILLRAIRQARTDMVSDRSKQ